MPATETCHSTDSEHRHNNVQLLALEEALITKIPLGWGFDHVAELASSVRDDKKHPRSCNHKRALQLHSFLNGSMGRLILHSEPGHGTSQ